MGYVPKKIKCIICGNKIDRRGRNIRYFICRNCQKTNKEQLKKSMTDKELKNERPV